MPTLRERLADLSAARAPAAVLDPQALSPPFSSRPQSGPGYSVSQEIFPLTARRWLGHLATAHPEGAALLTKEPPPRTPPLSHWLFLDLETTGLAGGTGTHAFLVGVGQPTPAGFRLQQFFLRDLAGEGALLAALTPLLRQASVLVTYNGKLFDAPLLETRFRLARLPFTLEGKLHLDLLYPARRLWKLRWGSVRLLDLERNLFGFARPEDVPGRLIPQLYFDYLRSGDERPLQWVFRHNAEDVVTLAALAARMLHLVAEPEAASDHSLELFGLARLFERTRQFDRARALYERALVSGLETAVEDAARYRLSLLYKRQRDYRRAVCLWRELVEASARDHGKENFAVYEELAICYEHRLEDPETAMEVTRRALAEIECLPADKAGKPWCHRRAQERFAHRLERLNRKRARKALALQCTSLRE